MKFLKSQLARKLLLFIFSVTFILIIGSFLYFYFSGKSFLVKSAENEIELFRKYFDQSALTQINEFNNEINGAFVEDLYGMEKIHSNEAFSRFVNSILNIGNEYYFYDKLNNRTFIITSTKVFGGEEVLSKNEIDQIQFNKLSNSIKVIKTLDKTSYYCYASRNGINDHYIKKELKNLTFIIKLNGLFLFNQLIQKIYFPPKISFSILTDNNIFKYSTNKFYINQKLEKYFPNNISSHNSFASLEKNVLAGSWKNQLFNNILIITNDISKELDDFYEIIYRLLFYSIIIYLLINIVTLVYLNKLSKSLNEISNVTKKIGEGKFSSKINLRRKDEVGDLILSFNTMVDNLRESYSELSETKNELTKKQKLALIGETISKISHEIQNKISGVSVWVQNLEMQSSLDENTEIYVKEIKRSLSSFVDMLLNFKKFYRKPYLEKQLFDFTDLIQKIIFRFKNDIEAKQIKMEISNPEYCEVFADKNLIDETITNLLVNAVYFSPKEEVIKIEIDKRNNSLQFAIQNQGPKIEDENIENIFNPFFTTKSSGSGLGLAICKNIIEAHDGEIKAVNLIPNGTRFEFYLPLNTKNVS